MRYLFTLLLFLVAWWTTAQSEKHVRFGATYPTIKSNNQHFVVDATTDELIAIKETAYPKAQKGNGTLTIQVFNLNTLKQKQRQDELELPNNIGILAPLYFHETTYLFYRGRSDNRNDKQLWAQAIDASTAGLKGAPIHLIDQDPLSSYNLTQSPDKKTLLVQGLKPSESSDDSLRLSFYSFGKGLQPLTKAIVTLPYSKQWITISDFCVDNRGIPYLLLKVYHETNKRDLIRTKIRGSWRKQTIINYHLELLTLNPYNGSFKINKILLDTLLPNQFHLEASPDNKIYCAGYYTSKDSKLGGSRGLFVWELEPIAGVLRERYYPIPLEVMTQYEQPEEQRTQARAGLKGNAEMAGLDLNTLQFHNDGSVLVNASVARMETRSYMSNRQLQAYQVYLYQGIFVTKIYSDGSLAWINKIPKNQQSTHATDRLGYTYFHDANRHYYLHMDHIKNERLGKFDVPKVYKDGESGTIRVAILDHQTGELRRKPLIHTRKQRNSFDYRLLPFSHRHVIPSLEGKVVLELDMERKQTILMEVDMEE